MQIDLHIKSHNFNRVQKTEIGFFSSSRVTCKAILRQQFSWFNHVALDMNCERHKVLTYVRNP